jgi:transposase
MSQAYIQVFRNNLLKAVVVFDLFHIIKRYNVRLSDFRRQLLNPIEAPQKKQVVKRIRWLLLNYLENLNTDRSELNRLKAALEHKKSLAATYFMKGDHRQA